MSGLMQPVYQAFDPAPLGAGGDALYVDLDEVRGSSGLVDELANSIRLSATRTCQLVTGHRGSGKTTELRQLQNKLEKGEQKLFVVFCEIDNDVDRNDVDFPDILIAIVRQIATQLNDKLGIKLKPGYFKQRFDELKGFLASDVSIDKIELSTGLLKLSTAIKSSPNTRMEIRKLLEPNTNNLLYAANEVISEAVLELSKKDYKGLAVIVDDLDKMVLRPYPGADYSTGEYLFINRESQLSDFNCHMIYTLPLALAYSCKERTISNLYGINHIPIVPMTKIKTKTGEVHKAGFDRFREVVDKRLKKAGVDLQQVFGSEDVRDKLIELSGGQPRELMNLVREAIVTGDLPIDLTAIEDAARKIRHAYARQLQKEHWKIITSIRKGQKLARTEKNDKHWMELLDSRAVLQYVNDEEWYSVNPLVPEQQA